MISNGQLEKDIKGPIAKFEPLGAQGSKQDGNLALTGLEQPSPGDEVSLFTYTVRVHQPSPTGSCTRRTAASACAKSHRLRPGQASARCKKGNARKIPVTAVATRRFQMQSDRLYLGVWTRGRRSATERGHSSRNKGPYHAWTIRNQTTIPATAPRSIVAFSCNTLFAGCGFLPNNS